MKVFNVIVKIRNEETGVLRKEIKYVDAFHWEDARVKAYEKVRPTIPDYELIMEVYVEEGELPWN